MQDYYEFGKSLRKLLRRADRFGYDRQRLAEEVLYIAENYEKVAEHLELQMIVQMQRDAVETF
jgi:hypothetical protein